MIAGFDGIAAAIGRAFEPNIEAGEGRDLIQVAAWLEALDRGEGLDFDAVMDEVDDSIADGEANGSA